MSNRYLIKLADMQKIFTRATAQPSSVPLKSIAKNTPQTTMPKRSVSTTEHRNLLEKSATAPAEKASLLAEAGKTIGGFARGVGGVVSGTGTAASRVGSALFGKGRNEAAYQGLLKTNPHATQAEVDTFLGQKDSVIKDHLTKHSPEHLQSFKREANLRDATRVGALGVAGTLAYNKYKEHQQNQDAYAYQNPQYY